MASPFSSKRRAPLPQIDIHVARDRDNDNDDGTNDDDNDGGGRLTPIRTVIPSATTTARPSRSSFPVQGTPSVSVTASQTTPNVEASAVPVITVTAPAQTATLFVTVNTSPVTTATQLAPTTGDGANTLAPEFNTTRTSTPPAMITRSGVAWIGGLGAAGTASLRILLLGGKMDAADLHL